MTRVRNQITPTGNAARSFAQFSKSIATRIDLLPTDKLKANSRRSRTHDERQISMIMGSFSTFGLVNPLVVDQDLVILAGHARLEAAKRLGIIEVPVVRIDHLTETEKRAYVIADNRIAEKAGWDVEVLAEELRFLSQTIEFETEVIGFDSIELDVLLEPKSEAEDEPDPADIIPDVPALATSRLGDVWQLGRHRVLCGSALDRTSYADLIADMRVRMVLTDPPYNVAIQGFVSGLGKTIHREFAMASGEMSDDEFISFLTAALAETAQFSIDGALIYVFMDWRGQFAVMRAAQSLGLRQHNLCVWDKGSGGMGSHYRSQHELCLIYKKGRAPHVNTVELGKNGRNRTNVWRHPGMASFGKGRTEALAMHPTVKPVNLLADAIKDASHRGDLILDPFLGSGSTIIAAEKTGRVCRGIELDPLYVDTIVRRFESFAGVEATLIGSSATFEAVRRRREEETSREHAATNQDPDVARTLPVRARQRPVQA